MKITRPGAVTAAAVMCIIYGSLSTLGGLCGAGALVVQGIQRQVQQNQNAGNDPAALFQKELEDTLEAEVPAYKAVTITSTVVGLVTAVTLLIAGISLLGMKTRARTVAIVFCFIVMCSLAFHLVYSTVYVVPAMKKAMTVGMPKMIQQMQLKQGMPAAAQAKAKEAAEVLAKITEIVTVGAAVAGIIVNGLWIAYMVVIILLLRRPHVLAAFAGAASAGFDEPQRTGTGELPRRRRRWPRRRWLERRSRK